MDWHITILGEIEQTGLCYLLCFVCPVALIALVILAVQLLAWKRAKQSITKEMITPFPVEKRTAETNNYPGGLIRVHSEPIHNGVRLRWECKPSILGKNYYILGKRSYSYGSYEFVERPAGSHEMDQPLDAGFTHSFKFKVVEVVQLLYFHKVVTVLEEIGFTVTIPSHADRVRELEKAIEARTLEIQLASLNSLPPPQAPARDEKSDRIIKQVNSFMDLEEKVTALEARLIEQIESKGYPPKVRKEKIERLRARIKDLCAEEG